MGSDSPGWCSVCFTAIGKNDGHIPPGPIWCIEWLPKGYGPSPDDQIICVIPDRDEWSGYGVRDGSRPPLVEAIRRLVEEALRRGK